MSLALFAAGTRLAAERGLILVDTKYEFGKTASGDWVVMDEIHTPDSSRYFYAEGYEELLAADEPQRQLSKEFVREWLMERGFRGRSGETLPSLSDDFRLEVTRRYTDLYETLTGTPFVPDPSDDPHARIAANLSEYAAEAA
jgi:phosphoribosylaminoimidazole-succinocarboxamide synthase